MKLRDELTQIRMQYYVKIYRDIFSVGKIFGD